MDREELDNLVELVFTMVNKKYGLKFGDISPENSRALDRILDEFIDIINSYIRGNGGDLDSGIDDFSNWLGVDIEESLDKLSIRKD